MVVTFLQKIAFAFKKTYCAWLTALLHVQPRNLEDGGEHSIAVERYREEMYAKTVTGRH